MLALLQKGGEISHSLSLKRLASDVVCVDTELVLILLLAPGEQHLRRAVSGLERQLGPHS